MARSQHDWVRADLGQSEHRTVPPMGVDFSKEAGRPPLSIACVAEISQRIVEVLPLDAAQFRTFHEAVQTKRSPIQRRRSSLSTIEPVDTASDHKLDNATWRAYDLTAVHFEHALELSAIAPHDRIVLERLFTIMDRSGDDVINSLELLIAMALLVRGPFNAKLEFAVDCLVQHLHDKPLTPAHLVFLVSTMTTVANCFGDPLLPLPVLEAIADDVFEELSGLSGAAPECDSSPAVSVAVQALAAHPFMQEYISQDKSAWSPR